MAAIDVLRNTWRMLHELPQDQSVSMTQLSGLVGKDTATRIGKNRDHVVVADLVQFFDTLIGTQGGGKVSLAEFQSKYGTAKNEVWLQRAANVSTYFSNVAKEISNTETKGDGGREHSSSQYYVIF